MAFTIFPSGKIPCASISQRVVTCHVMRSAPYDVSGNTGHGIHFDDPTARCFIGGGNGGDGIYNEMTKLRLGDLELTNNSGYGYRESASGTRSIWGGTAVVNSNALGNFLFNANGRRHVGAGLVDYDSGSS